MANYRIIGIIGATQVCYMSKHCCEATLTKRSHDYNYDRGVRSRIMSLDDGGSLLLHRCASIR